MDTKDIIDNILDKNYTGANDAINSALHAKVADNFEAIKLGMGADYSGYELADDEDYEEPEELADKGNEE